VRQLPHSVSLQDRFGDDLAVVTISLDDADAREQVVEILQDAEANTINLISSYTWEEKPAEKFNVPGGTIPHYQIYDRDGKLFQSLASDDPDYDLTTELIDQTVEAAINAPPGTVGD